MKYLKTKSYICDKKVQTRFKNKHSFIMKLIKDEFTCLSTDAIVAATEDSAHTVSCEKGGSAAQSTN